MNPSAAQVNAGQAVYNSRTLSLYDVIVLGISNRYIWKCPSHHLESHYRRHLSANHLDVGVATGYFLDRCPFPSAAPRVALMDLNAESLAFTSRRISRYRPEKYLWNVLEPVHENIAKFDSIGLNYLLHCLPGSIEEKAVVFDHLLPLTNPGAVIFGSTILHSGVPRGSFARGLMAFYNSKGIFSNSHDDLEGLERSLSRRFEKVDIQLVGCVALFSAA